MNRTISFRAYCWPAIIAGLIFWASSRAIVAAPDISFIDKIGHFGVFGLLATLLCRLRPGRPWAIRALLAATLFGVTDEWHQFHVPGRTPEVSDWIADTLGAGTAVWLYAGWTWYREWLETPLSRLFKRTPAAQETGA